MAIDFTAKYPGRFDPVSALYPQGKFKNRSAPNTEDGSYMERDWLNDWNGFFGALLKNANVTPNGTVDTATASQLYDALRLVTGGKYGTALVGSLVYWPLQQMPQEIFTDLGQVYIPYIGQTFDPVTYPLLKRIHPSGSLPADMRGEFARGWDNGRRVDPDRTIMSNQVDSIQSFSGTFSPRAVTSALGAIAEASGVFSVSARTGSAGATELALGAGKINLDVVTMNISSQVRTSSETRPRNIAWNMIVRAA